MAQLTQEQVTELIHAISSGDSKAADQLIDLVYEDLRRLAASFLRHEHNHSWDSAELVDEAYMKLVGQDVKWQGRTHFIAIAARSMRRLLVDHARHKLRDKRGGKHRRVELDESIKVSNRNEEDVLVIDDAIRKLEELDPRQAQIVEMRFFGGMTVQEVAEVLGSSKRSVEREWTVIRAWLRKELDGLASE